MYLNYYLVFININTKIKQRLKDIKESNQIDDLLYSMRLKIPVETQKIDLYKQEEKFINGFGYRYNSRRNRLHSFQNII